jgi:hypothetical protein
MDVTVVSGDMLSNHVKSTSPANYAVGAPIQSSIIIAFDASIVVLNPAQALVVVDEARERIAGTTTYDEATHTLVFVPAQPLPSDRRIYVHVGWEERTVGIVRGTSKTMASISGFEFTFKTQVKPPVPLFVQLFDQPETRTRLTIDVASPRALERLKIQVCSCMEPKQDRATVANLMLMVGDVQVRLDRDSDVAQLRDNDVIALALKGQEGMSYNDIVLMPIVMIVRRRSAQGEAKQAERLVVLCMVILPIFTPVTDASTSQFED